MPHEPYAVLKLRDFRLLVLGRLFVTLGIEIQSMAVGWQVYAVTKDPLSLGFAGLASALPSIAVALYAGHIADIVDRKSMTLMSVALLVITMFGLATASISIHNVHALTLIIYACIAVAGLVRGFYGPAVFGLVSQIVSREQYANASAWNSAVWQGSAILGPIIGGWLYLTYSAAPTYFGSGVLIVVGFMALSLIHSKTDLSAVDGKAPIVESIKEGLEFVLSHQIVLGAMTLDLFAVLFGGAVALLPIFADEIFHRGPAALGLMRAAPAIGALFTASILAHFPLREDAGKAFLMVVAGFGLCMIGFGLAKDFYLAVGLLALSGAFDGVSVYLRSTIYQLATPSAMKGRVAAVNSIFIGSSNEIGEFESGVAARIFGTVPSVVLGGCLTLVVVMITALKAPQLRRLNLHRMEQEVQA